MWLHIHLKLYLEGFRHDLKHTRYCLEWKRQKASSNVADVFPTPPPIYDEIYNHLFLMLYLFLKLAPACLCATIGICYLRYWSNLLLLWDKHSYKIIDFYVIFIFFYSFINRWRMPTSIPALQFLLLSKFKRLGREWTKVVVVIEGSHLFLSFLVVRCIGLL